MPEYVTASIAGYGEVGYTAAALERAAAESRGKTAAVLRQEAGTRTDGGPLPGVALGGLGRRDLIAVLAGQRTARDDARRELAAQEAADYAVAGAVGSDDGEGTVYDVRARVPGFGPLLVIVRVSGTGEVTRVIDDSGAALAGARRDKASAAVAAYRSRPAPGIGRAGLAGARRAHRLAAVPGARPAARRA
jgi:hypothetical protein